MTWSGGCCYCSCSGEHEQHRCWCLSTKWKRWHWREFGGSVEGIAAVVAAWCCRMVKRSLVRASPKSHSRGRRLMRDHRIEQVLVVLGSRVREPGQASCVVLACS